MKKNCFILILALSTVYPAAYAAQEKLALEQKEGALAVPLAQERDPFFVYFNFQKKTIEVSHSTPCAASPHSLFSGKHTITHLEIDFHTGDTILEEACTRSFDSQLKKNVCEPAVANQLIIDQLKSKAKQALASNRWRRKRSTSLPQL